MKLILSILMLLSMNLYSESFAKLKMSCDIGNKHSCFDVGLAYFEGNGVEQDYDKAEKLFDNACEQGNIVACHTLGDMHQENKDYQKARDSYKKACAGGDICGCDALKHIDSTISRKKKEISDKKAGIVYISRSAIKFFDQTKASKLCKACNDSGQIEACYELAMMNHRIRGGGHEEKAMKLFAKICDTGEVKGCFYLGKGYNWGIGVKRNRSKAISIYDDTCKRGYMKGCRALAEMFLYLSDRTEQESATTLQALTKACDGEDMEGCNLLGEMYSNGKIVEENSIKAMELYAKSCAGGENLACSNYERQKETDLEREKEKARLADLNYQLMREEAAKKEKEELAYYNNSSLSCDDHNGYAVQKLKQVGGYWDYNQAIDVCNNIAQTARLIGRNEKDLFDYVIKEAISRSEKGIESPASTLVILPAKLRVLYLDSK